MVDVNPYEPPREPEPLTRGQIVKRSVGVAAIMLLTPPAIVVAAAMGCGVSFVSRPPSPLLVPLISAVIPFAVLCGMMMWAIAVDRQERCSSKRPSWRSVVLIAIVPIFGIAQVLGFIMALGTFVVVEKAVGGGNITGFAAGAMVSGLTPFVTLLFMLWRAG